MITGNATLDALLNTDGAARAAYGRKISDAFREGAHAVTDITKKSEDVNVSATEAAANSNFPWFVPLSGLPCKAQAIWESMSCKSRHRLTRLQEQRHTTAIEP